MNVPFQSLFSRKFLDKSQLVLLDSKRILICNTVTVVEAIAVDNALCSDMLFVSSVHIVL